jgi:hypothetical protein
VITVKLTKQEGWALVRATAAAQDTEHAGDTSAEDKPHLEWAGRRLLGILNEELNETEK